MKISIRKTIISDSEELEKIHLKYYAEIGQSVGDIEFDINRSNMINLTAISDDGEIVGYIIASYNGNGSYAEWIGVKYEGNGIGKQLVENYFQECKRLGITFISATTRNRFRTALIGYMKNGFNIIGVFQALDGDLMIQMRKELKE